MGVHWMEENNLHFDITNAKKVVVSSIWIEGLRKYSVMYDSLSDDISPLDCVMVLPAIFNSTLRKRTRIRPKQIMEMANTSISGRTHCTMTINLLQRTIQVNIQIIY